MIGKYVILFLVAVLGGMLGGLITHLVYRAVQNRKLRNWRPKEKTPHWVTSSKTNC